MALGCLGFRGLRPQCLQLRILESRFRILWLPYIGLGNHRLGLGFRGEGPRLITMFVPMDSPIHTTFLYPPPFL